MADATSSGHWSVSLNFFGGNSQKSGFSQRKPFFGICFGKQLKKEIAVFKLGLSIHD